MSKEIRYFRLCDNEDSYGIIRTTASFEDIFDAVEMAKHINDEYDVPLLLAILNEEQIEYEYIDDDVDIMDIYF